MKPITDPAERKGAALRVSRVSILVNLVLSVLKLAAGIFAHSAAMVSDAVHSASDVFSTVVVIAGVKLASRDADEDHPYGHDRLECAAAILLAVCLCATGIGIGAAGIRSLVSGSCSAVPGLAALLAAVLSIAVKELMYHYTIRTANAIGSAALKADAWHHRSDALSSVGSFLGILGARLGFPVLDPIASLVICAFIIRASVSVFTDSVNRMTDRACDEKTVEEMRGVIRAIPGVLGIDLLKTRVFGSGSYVDVEIRADGTLHLTEAHAIAEQVHAAIEREFPTVRHCMVHVNPDE